MMMQTFLNLSTKPTMVIIVIMYIIAVIYVSWQLCKQLYNRKKAKSNLDNKRVYHVVCSLHKGEFYKNIPKAYDQICISCESDLMPDQNITTYIQKALKHIISCYHVLDDKQFKIECGGEKSDGVQRFALDIYDYIEKKSPFISLPVTEAALLTKIKTSLENGSKDLGLDSVQLLAKEIEADENERINQARENSRNKLISILGIIFTTFFGILSIVIAGA